MGEVGLVRLQVRDVFLVLRHIESSYGSAQPFVLAPQRVRAALQPRVLLLLRFSHKS